ncbi:MAG: YqeG family HAD IIIA-type phosphatase [Acholeplasma sp.]|nr:YqeG family HAD IIIA-type phosphatase [Acholeplasma sp.]
MKFYKKFIPTQYVKDIKEIKYDCLLKQGIKALFFDLDNTIIPYDISVIPPEIKNYLEQLNEDFKVVVVSNSRKKRVYNATINLEKINVVKFARKPFKFGFKKALKFVGLKPSEVALIGDQLMTDVYGGNRMKFKEIILVKPVKQKSDHLFTRINRYFERRMIKKISIKEPEIYEKVLSQYEK